MTYPGSTSGVGAEYLLDPARLLEELGHRPSVSLDRVALRLHLLDHNIPHDLIKLVSSDIDIKTKAVDRHAGNVLKLGLGGEGVGVGEHGGFERDEGGGE